jgi:ketosteroid isomerase-like protein
MQESRAMNLHELFASIDAKDTQRFLGFLTEDALFRYGSSSPVTGHPAIRAQVEQVFSSIRSCTHRLKHDWHLPGFDICQGEVTYVRLDGRSIDVPFCNVFEVRAEKIARYEVYLDPTPLFSA